MGVLLVLQLRSTVIVLLDTLLPSLFFDAQTFLPLIFILFKTALAVELVGLTSQTLLLKLGSTLLFGGLGGESSPLSVFLFNSNTLSLLLFLPQTILSLELVTSQSELFSITFGLQTFSLL